MFKLHFPKINVLVAMVSLLLTQCYYDNEQALYHTTVADCSTINAKFTADVLPILVANCATPSCHNSAAAGGVILQTYDEIFAKVSRINQRTLIDKTMPPSGSLTPADVAILKCWISGGALNN